MYSEHLFDNTNTGDLHGHQVINLTQSPDEHLLELQDIVPDESVDNDINNLDNQSIRLANTAIASVARRRPTVIYITPLRTGEILLWIMVIVMLLLIIAHLIFI